MNETWGADLMASTPLAKADAAIRAALTGDGDLFAAIDVKRAILNGVCYCGRRLSVHDDVALRHMFLKRMEVH
jgi:hypothetical protein